MSCPVYVNHAEILTWGNKDEGDSVIIRFAYKEPQLSEEIVKAIGRPYPLNFGGPAVIMPRNIAKDFLKRFLGFMAVQDEHGVGKKI